MDRLGQVELVQDLMRHFLYRARLRVHEHIRPAIKWFPFRQQLADAVERIRTMKKRPMALMADSMPDCFR